MQVNRFLDGARALHPLSCGLSLTTITRPGATGTFVGLSTGSEASWTGVGHHGLLQSCSTAREWKACLALLYEAESPLSSLKSTATQVFQAAMIQKDWL